MGCEHEVEQIDAVVDEVLATRCASLVDDCTRPPVRYLVAFRADDSSDPAVHISPSCKHHLRACRKAAERWNRGESWFGLREIGREEVSSMVEWLHGPAGLCGLAGVSIDGPSVDFR